MAQTNFTPILTYKSDTATVVPPSGNLTNSANGAELAVNTADKRLFTKNSGGSVVELGTNPSSVTLPNGTANGVAFLDASKVLTTGSALVFDGTKLKSGVFGNTGRRFEVNGSEALFDGAGAFDLVMGDGAVAYMSLSTTDNGVSMKIRNFSGNSDIAVFERISGNVGIGTSSPAFKLDVAGTTRLGAVNSAILAGVGGAFVGGQGELFTVGANTMGLGTTGSASMQLYTASTERMRIDSSGNVGIGTSSPGAKLDVSSGAVDEVARFQGNGSPYLSLYRSGTRQFYINSNSAATSLIVEPALPLAFSTNGTERMRIDSSGNLILGTTNSDLSASSFGIAFRIQSGGQQIRLNTSGATDTNSVVLRTNGSDVFRVATNGGIANFQANDSNLSDRREKTNFAPAKSYLETICAIPVQTFNFISQEIEACDGSTLGVVAQDMQAVAPELVMESNWGTDEKPKMRLSIYQTDLQYALMKCIQEQQALITALTARITALESN